ncbi:MAG: cytochrome c3 family protein [Desulfovibrio sp.]|jgi:fumarate reductase flavoprotein subunit|nr:cytochrome c3 family protein [Desulfovibrio sp.]
MKRIIPHCFLFLAASVIPLMSGIVAAQEPPGKCATECHTDMRTVLPEKHMIVEGEDNISSCMQCHLPSSETRRDTHVFSAKVHKKHFSEKKLECSYCHIIDVGKSFSLPGRESIGVPDEQTMKFLPEITAEWAKSPFLATIHAKKDVACSSCHGDKLPVLDDKPENAVCFKCHGSYEQLAEKTPGKDHISRNPHASHLGVVNCRLCHKAHEASITYCLDCHKFEMNPIPGGKQ